MKRYLIFSGDNYYPAGGIGDLLITCDEIVIQDVIQAIINRGEDNYGDVFDEYMIPDWVQAYDCVDEVIVEIPSKKIIETLQAPFKEKRKQDSECRKKQLRESEYGKMMRACERVQNKILEQYACSEADIKVTQEKGVFRIFVKGDAIFEQPISGNPSYREITSKLNLFYSWEDL